MTSTFHPVTYHSCVGRLIVNHHTLTFQADEEDDNNQHPPKGALTRLKWSHVTKLRANKASCRVAKLRVTTKEQHITKKGGEEKRSYFTFASRSELERARTQMKIYIQLHCEKNHQAKPDPGRSSSHEDTSRTEEDFKSDESSKAHMELRNKGVSSNHKISGNNTSSTMSCGTSSSSNREGPAPLQTKRSRSRLSSHHRPFLRKISSEPSNSNGASQSENELPLQSTQPHRSRRHHHHHHRRRIHQRWSLLRKTSSDGDLRQQMTTSSRKRSPFRKASSEHDMPIVILMNPAPPPMSPQPIVLRSPPPPPPPLPPPAQPIVLATESTSGSHINWDTLAPVVMSPSGHLAKQTRSPQSLELPRSRPCHSEEQDIETGTKHNGDQCAEHHDVDDTISISKRQCAEYSFATSCFCCCCIILAVVIFLIVYFVKKNEESPEEKARKDFFSDADGAYWVRQHCCRIH